MLDLGFIYNSKDVKNYTLQGSATNNGVNVFIPGDVDNLGLDLWEELVDEIEESVPFEEDGSGFITLRPLKVHGSIRYDFGKGGNFNEDCDCTINPKDRHWEAYYRNSVGRHLFLLKRPLAIQPALTGFYQKGIYHKDHLYGR